MSTSRSSRGPPPPWSCSLFGHQPGEYEGELVNGVRHGRGRCVSSNGMTYCGEWRDGYRHGRGRYTMASGAVYEGEFEWDRSVGRGQQAHSNGSCHTGSVADMELRGLGVFISTTGVTYTGMFERGTMCGMGVLSSVNTHCEGLWCRGTFLRRSRGTSVTADDAAALAAAPDAPEPRQQTRRVADSSTGETDGFIRESVERPGLRDVACGPE